VKRVWGIMDVMNIQQNVPLSNYSTMRLGSTAAYLAEIQTKDDLLEAIKFAESKYLPTIMIGDGSNIVWSDKPYPGLVLVNKIKGFEKFNKDDHIYITVGAGENWDSIVKRTVDDGLTGIECLSLIPGTAGATPVQNVGAYGQETSETLVNVEAYDCQQKQFVTILGEDCAFGYRTSRFKTNDKGRFFIVSVTSRLKLANPMPPFYGAVQDYLSEHKISEYSPRILRDAVIAIRKNKLPDPTKVANNGSFFANPIIDKEKFDSLLASYPNLKYWQTDDGKYKLAAGWLVEQAGFKDAHDKETGMATWSNQALVLVNENAKSSADLLKFKQKIVDKVSQMFGITLEQEPKFVDIQ